AELRVARPGARRTRDACLDYVVRIRSGLVAPGAHRTDHTHQPPRRTRRDPRHHSIAHVHRADRGTTPCRLPHRSAVDAGVGCCRPLFRADGPVSQFASVSVESDRKWLAAELQLVIALPKSLLSDVQAERA